MTDPCGGNTKGGEGCTCDPPFGRTLVDRYAAAIYVRRHPDQIRRRCQPVHVDAEGRALYDLDEVEAAFADVRRRVRLTAS